MRAIEEFPLDNEGRLSVKKSGLYYIYAQVNYLDEHDVNAFQVNTNINCRYFDVKKLSLGLCQRGSLFALHCDDTHKTFDNQGQYLFHKWCGLFRSRRSDSDPRSGAHAQFGY